MIVVEIYTFDDGLRFTDTVEFNSIKSWEMHYFQVKLADTWVGHKIFDCSMREYIAAGEHREVLVDYTQLFDKGAFRDGINKLQEKVVTPQSLLKTIRSLQKR